MNDELHAERIIVQDVEEDLYDGQVRAFRLIFFSAGILIESNVFFFSYFLENNQLLFRLGKSQL